MNNLPANYGSKEHAAELLKAYNKAFIAFFTETHPSNLYANLIDAQEQLDDIIGLRYDDVETERDAKNFANAIAKANAEDSAYISDTEYTDIDGNVIYTP